MPRTPDQRESPDAILSELGVSMEEFLFGWSTKIRRPVITKARRWVYQMFALEDGLTVAEFENMFGWPSGTLYPKRA